MAVAAGALAVARLMPAGSSVQSSVEVKPAPGAWAIYVGHWGCQARRRLRPKSIWTRILSLLFGATATRSPLILAVFL